MPTTVIKCLLEVLTAAYVSHEWGENIIVTVTLTLPLRLSNMLSAWHFTPT